MDKKLVDSTHHHHHSGLKNHVGITAIVGPPCCGKSKLLNILKEAAALLQGFLFCDMSDDIIEWHKDPKNHSPLMEAFVGSEETRSKGNLLNNVIINAAVADYIHFQREERRKFGQRIHHVVISGWPRTEYQISDMLSMDHNARVVHIEISEARADENRIMRIKNGIVRKDDEPVVFASRWEKYRTITRPDIQSFENLHGVQFISVQFTWAPAKKAEFVMRRMNITPVERGSLIKRIHEPNSKAAQLIEEIMGSAKDPAIHAQPIIMRNETATLSA